MREDYSGVQNKACRRIFTFYNKQWPADVLLCPHRSAPLTYAPVAWCHGYSYTQSDICNKVNKVLTYCIRYIYNWLMERKSSPHEILLNYITHTVTLTHSMYI